MDWSDEQISRLRALWSEGHSTAEIGRRMGISKNAVVGKAHRLNLSARPSPIRRVPGAPQAPRAPRPAPMRAAERMGFPPRSFNVVAAGHALRPVAPPPPRPVAPPAPPPPPRLSNTSCCWPIGEPGKPDFRFCSDRALVGKPYCEAHAAQAYVRARPRHEDAA
ncbi:MAG: GcrA cell cycle regulator [Acetobacteraceae bacterium]|nr:GcrA cell cycle regulator [Acetobacteraceae bacterium]